MLDGSSEKYQNLIEATGYGDIQGLAGVNCRHHISSYIEGVTKLPTRALMKLKMNVFIGSAKNSANWNAMCAKPRSALRSLKQMDDKELIRSLSSESQKLKTDKLERFRRQTLRITS